MLMSLMKLNGKTNGLIEVSSMVVGEMVGFSPIFSDIFFCLSQCCYEALC